MNMLVTGSHYLEKFRLRVVSSHLTIKNYFRDGFHKVVPLEICIRHLVDCKNQPSILNYQFTCQSIKSLGSNVLLIEREKSVKLLGIDLNDD